MIGASIFIDVAFHFDVGAHTPTTAKEFSIRLKITLENNSPHFPFPLLPSAVRGRETSEANESGGKEETEKCVRFASLHSFHHRPLSRSEDDGDHDDHNYVLFPTTINYTMGSFSALKRGPFNVQKPRRRAFTSSTGFLGAFSSRRFELK